MISRTVPIPMYMSHLLSECAKVISARGAAETSRFCNRGRFRAWSWVAARLCGEETLGVSELEAIGGEVEDAISRVRVHAYVIDAHGTIRWLNPAAGGLGVHSRLEAVAVARRVSP